MIKVAVTGGIGSGKSYVCKLLAKRGISVYDCDDAAKRLMRSSERIKNALVELVGENVYESDRLNKAVLTSFLLQSDENTRKINAIVHPAVAEDFISSGMNWMECAILFTSGFNRFVDKVVCVTAPQNVRVQRIVMRDGISEDKALEWINIQMPQEELLHRSDYEIVNDGMADVEQQIDKILRAINS